MTPIILYIHVPFCRFRCDYCDFFTRTRVPAERQFQIVNRTVLAALDALQRWYTPNTPISSIYVGGGTPSSVHEHARQRLLQGIRQCIDYGTLTPKTEITVEVNPEDVDATLLRELDHSGVNRLSLGVQSLRSETLSRIGRHTSLSATRTGLETVAGTWSHHWSVDIITAIPGQSTTDAEQDTREVLEFHPHHVSLYELGIEPGTRLALTKRRGMLPRNPENRRLHQFTAAAELLGAAGLNRYEISSFARPGRESRHNLAYWQMHPWTAAGPGAVALLPHDGRATHFTIGHRFRDFLEGEDSAASREPLTSRELCEEYFMGGFRMTRGIAESSLVNVFGHTLKELIPHTLSRWRSDLCYGDSGFITLTDAGRLLLNRFLVDAFGELERSTKLPAVPHWPETTMNAASTATTAT